MLIGYFADGKWSHKALDLILSSDQISVAFVCARYDNPDPILREKAINLGIDFLVEKDINNSLFRQKLNNYECDLFVSMSFNQIFEKLTFQIPRNGTINCHAGQLPFYRGRNVLNWALINDEKEFGITVHFIDEGIDSGDIILQKTYKIKDKDNYKTLLEKAYEECPKLLFQSIGMLINNNLKVIPQKNLSKSFMYCPKRIEGDEIIDWDKKSREIFNFIRALTKPGPCAQTFAKDNKIKIIKAELLPNAPKYIGIPGSILEVNLDYILIKTKDTFLKITEWESEIKLHTGLRLKKRSDKWF